MIRQACLAAALMLSCAAPAHAYDLWIGVAEPAGGVTPKGVYHATFDKVSGKPTKPRLVGEIAGAGFLATHPTLPVLYSTGGVEGEPSVVAWRIDADGQTGLARLNDQPTGDGGSCHLSVDATGQALMSAHYGGGSVAAFPLGEDGAIGPRASVVEHQGHSGVNAARQEAPHPHWIGPSPDNRFALAPDLGKDRVLIYRLDAASATLTPHGEGVTPPGGGPRHLAWRPDGRFAYVVDELPNRLSAYAWDAEAGRLELIDTQPMMSDAETAAEPPAKSSEVAMHPTGNFVYAAVRGYDRICVFAIDKESGTLTRVEREPVRGAWPRHFGVSPCGGWLVAAGRDSNTLSVFAIDQQTGSLRYTLESVSTPRPICVLIR
ncbi:MAG: lactonase family protein [Planctomycetota bacterium]